MMNPLTVTGAIKAYWKPAAVVLFLLLVWLHGHKSGADNMDAKWQLIFSKQQTQAALALQQATQAAREQEHQMMAAWDIAAKIAQEESDHALQERDRTIADLRSGRLRLKACPGLPQAPADTPATAQGAEGGQPGGFPEWVVNRLAVCDEVVSERNWAVSLLKAERR